MRCSRGLAQLDKITTMRRNTYIFTDAEVRATRSNCVPAEGETRDGLGATLLRSSARLIRPDGGT